MQRIPTDLDCLFDVCGDVFRQVVFLVQLWTGDSQRSDAANETATYTDILQDSEEKNYWYFKLFTGLEFLEIILNTSVIIVTL